MSIQTILIILCIVISIAIILPITIFGIIFLEYFKRIYDVLLSLHKMYRVGYEIQFEEAAACSDETLTTTKIN